MPVYKVAKSAMNYLINATQVNSMQLALMMLLLMLLMLLMPIDAQIIPSEMEVAPQR